MTRRILTLVWCALATGAGVGFIARDVLGLPGAAVALAWLLGALAGGSAAASRPPPV
jgi:hypothetical protein